MESPSFTLAVCTEPEEHGPPWSKGPGNGLKMSVTIGNMCMKLDNDSKTDIYEKLAQKHLHLVIPIIFIYVNDNGLHRLKPRTT